MAGIFGSNGTKTVVIKASCNLKQRPHNEKIVLTTGSLGESDDSCMSEATSRTVSILLNMINLLKQNISELVKDQEQ